MFAYQVSMSSVASVLSSVKGRDDELKRKENKKKSIKMNKKE